MKEMECITISDIMKRYKISRSKVLRSVENGDFPRGMRIGTTRHWPIKQIEAYEARQFAGQDDWA